MPFDTIEHSHKRLRYDGSWEDPEDAGYQFIPSQHPPPSHFWDNQAPDLDSQTSSSFLDWKTATLNAYQDPYYKIDTDYSSPILERKISIPSQFSTSPISDRDVLTSPTSAITYTTAIVSQQQDTDCVSSVTSATNTNSSISLLSPTTTTTTANTELRRVHDILTTTGVNVEAKITNATELRSLIDAFSKLCPSVSTISDDKSYNINESISSNQIMSPPLSSSKGITLDRNKLHKSKPINFFDSVCNLSHLLRSSSSKPTTLSLRQIGDACMDTFFTCWVRYSPIIDRKEFMMWYRAEPNPMETLIVNAICSLVFSHTVNHHTQPGLEIFKHDQELVLQQQDLFFDRSRKYLEISFDAPDRWTVVALLFMSCTAEPERRHHYSGMATCALLELEIYPRMVDDEDDSFEKEMDTRLWWFTWSLDFYLYSTGVPRNTPRTNRKGQVDMPRIYEEDIDEVEHGVLADIHCLKWWRFQSDVVADVYEQDNNMTEEQLRHYDDQLLQMYQELPDYLQWDSGFSYGCEDLLMVCIRVNVEFNATRMILHMPFLPDATNIHPTPTALQSLNICLKTALVQLQTIGSCNKDGRRCAFDRDELWRACEMISLSMDVYRNCDLLADRELLLQAIGMDDFTLGLHRAMVIMQESSEFKMGRKDWVQVNDWLKEEMARHHQLDTAAIATAASALQQQQSFSSNVGIPIKKEIDSSSPSSSSLSTFDSSLSVMYFPPALSSPTQQQQYQQPSLSSSSPPLSGTTKSNRKTSTSSSSTSSSDFTSFSPPNRKQSSSSLSTNKQSSQRQQPSTNSRFRYFNPRKMNKFLFIDDHPLL